MTAPPARRYLFCIGAQKAGTSWLHYYFAGHPEIHVPEIKELHFFNTFYGPIKDGREAALARLRRLGKTTQRLPLRAPSGPRDAGQIRLIPDWPRMADTMVAREALYREALHKGAGDALLLADITPGYSLVGAEGFRAMDAVGAGSLFLFILRDPVDRLWSACKMRARRSEGQRSRRRDTAFYAHKFLERAGSDDMARTDYGATLADLETVIPASRIRVMFYERLFQQHSIDGLCDFLGVGHHPADVDRRVYAGNRDELPDALATALAERFAPVYDWARDRFGDALPPQWRSGPRERN